MYIQKTYLCVRLENIPDLMQWGRSLMQEQAKDELEEMKKNHVSLDMLVICDQAIEERGDDTDELLVVRFTHYRKNTSKKKEFKRDLLGMISDLPQQYEDEIKKINMQDATFVYFLTE